MSDEATHQINTPEGMLRALLCVNEHGVWFVEIDGRYYLLPRWMTGHCKRACPKPRVIAASGT